MVLVKKKQLVITFTHTNYCLTSYGTEKFVREYSTLLQNNGYSHLVFFPLAQRGRSRYVGTIFQDKLIGIYPYYQMEDIILSFAWEHHTLPFSINIQHLKGHDIEYIGKLIAKFKLQVEVFIHDYYFICCNSRLIDSSGEHCGYNTPSAIKCKRCQLIKKAISHSTQMDTFYSSIDAFIERVIVPSEYVKNVFIKKYEYLANKLYVRPHLILSGVRNRTSLHDRVKIAFVGAQIPDKGYDEWKQLVSALPNERFEFYYFGFGEEVINNVTNIKVVDANNNKKMQEWLIEQEIDCALFWSHCAETYSYVYYELSVSGIYILTNECSGNVTDEVFKNQNGVIFTSFDECLEYLETNGSIENDINNYRNNGMFRPDSAVPNDTIMLSKHYEKNEVISSRGKKVKKAYVISMMYIMKHLLLNKGERSIIKILDRKRS